MIKGFFTPINKEGYIFIAIGVAVTIISNAFLPSFIFYISLLLTAFVVYFFRDPIRVAPKGENLIISPADGKVLSITEAKTPPPELELEDDLEYTKISIFLNVFNVHVNRIPFSGQITHLNYNPGKFFNASLDKASEHNERQSCVVEDSQGRRVIFVQIAGLIAKRVVCNLEPNQEVFAGEEFGIIRFGSRVDLYLVTKNVQIKALKDQTMIGGETVIAEFVSSSKS